MRLKAVSLLIAVTLLAATHAQAQVPTFDLERLQLDPTAAGSLVIGDGETMAQGSWRLSMAGHLEHRPLVLMQNEGTLRGRGMGASGSTVADLVKNRVTVHLGMAVAIVDRLELYLRVPVVAWQRGDDLTALGFAKPQNNGMGTPSAGLRLGLASQAEGAPVSLAVAGDVMPAWGTNGALAGNTGFTWSPRIEAGRRFARFLVAAQGFALFRESGVSLPKAETLGQEYGGGVAVSTLGQLRGELSARLTVNEYKLSKSAEILAGVRYAKGPVELFALAGPGFAGAPGTPAWRGLIGLALAQGPQAAPAAAAPAPAPAAAPAPAPKPDPCAKGQVHTPDQCPDLDDDGDGIVNRIDACPTVAGVPENKGCPDVDTDGDGIVDRLDKCPAEKGPAENGGCPDKDSDGDGVVDRLDKCPAVAGSAEYQGCPPPKAELKGGKIELKEAVYFDTSKATIQARSNALLDEVASILKANPQVQQVMVEGHTDAAGNAAANLKLSQARADAVKKYLEAKGIDGAKISAKGYGQTKPIADNKTAAGREKNRRVEFVVPSTPTK